MTGGEQKPNEIIGVRRGLFGVRGSGDTSGYGGLVQPISLPVSSNRPYGGYFDQVVDRLESVLAEQENVTYADAVEGVVVYRDQLTIT